MLQSDPPIVLPQANDNCWCGSGRKYKRCHKPLEGRVTKGTVTPMLTVPEHIARPSYADTGKVVRWAEPRVKNLVTRTDLFQIVTLAEMALFAVGNDTGPMHMATLAGAPGIALFALTESDPEHSAPRGPRTSSCRRRGPTSTTRRR